jgi:hypothetical protein
MSHKYAAALVFALLGSASANAQQISNARVLAGACGTTAPFPASSIAPGQTAGLFMDNTGHLCSSATGGGGGGGPVTLGVGSVALGAYLAGSLVDGAIVTLGNTSDASSANTAIGLLKAIKANVPPTTVGLSAGSAVIGKVDIDQTSPGTTNGVIINTIILTPTDCSVSATGSAQTVIASSVNLRKFSIASIDPVTGSGVPFWISFTAAAAAATIGSYPIAAPTATTYAGMGSYTDVAPPGTVINENVSVIAPSSYKISCTRW